MGFDKGPHGWIKDDLDAHPSEFLTHRAQVFQHDRAKRRMRDEIVRMKKGTTHKEGSATATKDDNVANMLDHDAMKEMRL